MVIPQTWYVIRTSNFEYCVYNWKGVTAPIVGFTTIEQLNELAGELTFFFFLWYC